MKKLEFFWIGLELSLKSTIGGIFFLLIGLFSFFAFYYAVLDFFWTGLNFELLEQLFYLILFFFIGCIFSLFGIVLIYNGIKKSKVKFEKKKKKFLEKKYRSIYKDKLISVTAPHNKDENWLINEATTKGDPNEYSDLRYSFNLITQITDKELDKLIEENSYQ